MMHLPYLLKSKKKKISIGIGSVLCPAVSHTTTRARARGGVSSDVSAGESRVL